MKRRSFLAALFAVPIAPAFASQVLDPEGVPDHEEYTKGKIKFMAFEDGELRLQVADVGQVRIGTIRPANGKASFDLARGVMTFKA